jgi:hypothetical protein
MNDEIDRRRSPRRSVNAIVPISIGAHVGRLLDVSDIGLRFELDWPAEDEVPSTLTLLIGTPSVAVPVVVAWKLREGDSPWICGALVATGGQAEWRRLLATLGAVGPTNGGAMSS